MKSIRRIIRESIANVLNESEYSEDELRRGVEKYGGIFKGYKSDGEKWEILTYWPGLYYEPDKFKKEYNLVETGVAGDYHTYSSKDEIGWEKHIKAFTDDTIDAFKKMSKKESIKKIKSV